MSFERVEIAGRRHYVTPLGKLPSVTTVLKATMPAKDREGLAKWRAREGEEKAAKILADSSKRGNALHASVEHYLKTGEEGTGPWWNSIASFVRSVDRSRPYLIEYPVWSPDGFAGCLDALGYAGEYETLMDWKTARKRKRREWVQDYERQAAAYTGAVNQARVAAGRTDLVTRAVVVVAYEDMQADVFHLDADDLKKRWREFKGRLREFQMRYGWEAK